jgi:hypothetical protein
MYGDEGVWWSTSAVINGAFLGGVTKVCLWEGRCGGGGQAVLHVRVTYFT